MLNTYYILVKNISFLHNTDCIISMFGGRVGRWLARRKAHQGRENIRPYLPQLKSNSLALFFVPFIPEGLRLTIVSQCPHPCIRIDCLSVSVSSKAKLPLSVCAISDARNLLMIDIEIESTPIDNCSNHIRLIQSSCNGPIGT